MTYNILLGFHRIDGQGYVLDEDRLKAAQKIVERENPDILGIVEAWFGAENYFNIFIDYKKIFNFKHRFFFHTKEGPGLAIFSKYKIKKSSSISNYEGSMGIKSQIEIGNKIINVDLIHPRYDATDSEKINFVENFISSKKEPHIIFGDFNAFSDEDEYEREILIKTFKTLKRKNPEESADKLLERKLIPYIKNKGLRDAFSGSKNKSYTIPTKRYRTGASSIRLDYIFHSPDIKVLETKTIKNQQTEITSDHYPISAILEIN